MLQRWYLWEYPTVYQRWCWCLLQFVKYGKNCFFINLYKNHFAMVGMTTSKAREIYTRKKYHFGYQVIILWYFKKAIKLSFFSLDLEVIFWMIQQRILSIFLKKVCDILTIMASSLSRTKSILPCRYCSVFLKTCTCLETVGMRVCPILWHPWDGPHHGMNRQRSGKTVPTGQHGTWWRGHSGSWSCAFGKK